MNTPKYLLQNVKNYPNEAALSIKDVSGNWQTDSWSELYSSVLSVSRSLLAYGIVKNDKVSIYSYNRKEWNISYLATQLVNGVAVGVYHTCSSNEVEWIVGNSESKIIFLGNNPNDNGEKEKMPNHRLLEVLDRLPKVELVVAMNDVEVFEHPKIISWDEFIKKGDSVDEKDVLNHCEQIQDKDTSSLINISVISFITSGFLKSGLSLPYLSIASL